MRTTHQLEYHYIHPNEAYSAEKKNYIDCFELRMKFVVSLPDYYGLQLLKNFTGMFCVVFHNLVDQTNGYSFNGAVLLKAD